MDFKNIYEKRTIFFLQKIKSIFFWWEKRKKDIVEKCLSDKSGGLLLPSLLRTYRVPFDTIGSSMHLSSKIRVSLFLLARYIRFCKLSTCRLTLYHLILFQSVASGFAGSQMLSFGVNLIISHHPLIVLYKYALYTRCIPFKSQPGYPCHSQWSDIRSQLHIFISSCYLSVNNGICFL
jgi:hypothetical protein